MPFISSSSYVSFIFACLAVGFAIARPVLAQNDIVIPICARAIVKNLPVLKGALAFRQSARREVDTPTPLVLSHLGLSHLIDDKHQTYFNVKFVGSYIYTSVSPKQLHQIMGVTTKGLEGASVLSLGEGYSGLVPWLLSKHADALGVDNEAYATTGGFPEHLAAYWNQLIPADATNLEQFAADSQSLVLSHDLLDVVGSEPSADYKRTVGSRERRAKVISESFRVAAPGGTIRHSIRLATSNDTAFRFANNPKLKAYVGEWAKALVAESLGSEPGTKYELALMLGTHQLELKELPTSGEPGKPWLAPVFDSSVVPKGMTVANYRMRMQAEANTPNLVLTIAIRKLVKSEVPAPRRSFWARLNPFS